MADMSGMAIRLGIAPIGWSNDDLHDLGGEIPLGQCLSEASSAGYTGIELGHKFPRDPVQLKQVLGKHNLDLASGWHSTFFTKEDALDDELRRFKQHLAFLKAMGCKVIICAECNKTRHSSLDAEPRQSGEPLFTEEEWELLSTRLDEAGTLARDAGLKLVYHHHMGTGVESAEEIDRLMRSTDPKLMYLLADTGHMLYSGAEPLKVFRKHADRIAHVHLKDIRREVLEKVRREKINFLNSVRMGVFTVPGDGCIDYSPIFGILESIGYSGWFIVEAEQDPALANPLEYAQKGRAYIRDKTGL